MCVHSHGSSNQPRKASTQRQVRPHKACAPPLKKCLATCCVWQRRGRCSPWMMWRLRSLQRADLMQATEGWTEYPNGNHVKTLCRTFGIVLNVQLAWRKKRRCWSNTFWMAPIRQWGERAMNRKTTKAQKMHERQDQTFWNSLSQYYNMI